VRCTATPARARSPAPPASVSAPRKTVRAPARLAGGHPIAASRHSPDRISFEVDRLQSIDPGSLEIRGRWYGVRGRRFVRPALILHGSKGPARRILAELDDKPWAALDGEPWQARFPCEEPLASSVTLELSVAPDIVVTLRPTAGAQSARTVDVPRPVAERPAPTSPSAPTLTPTRAKAGRAPETERLTARLTGAEAAVERERARREEAEVALEQARAEARERGAELGRARAELELARAAERESKTTADLLDASRRDHHAVQTRYDALADEHDRALRLTERLRSDLSAHEDDLAAAPRLEPPAHQERPPGLPPPPHTDRPLNPALRSNRWPLRLLALLVLAAVVIAVSLILHSTVLH
jgi:hypothetical protein